MFRVTVITPDRRFGGTFASAADVGHYLRGRVTTVRTDPGEYRTVMTAGFRPRPVTVRIEPVDADA